MFSKIAFRKNCPDLATLVLSNIMVVRWLWVAPGANVFLPKSKRKGTDPLSNGGL